jgi:hypothetical protein
MSGEFGAESNRMSRILSITLPHVKKEPLDLLKSFDSALVLQRKGDQQVLPVIWLIRAQRIVKRSVAMKCYQAMLDRGDARRLRWTEYRDDLTRQALACLPNPTQDVVVMRNGLSSHDRLTLQEVGDRLNCTRENVRIRELRFLNRLRYGEAFSSLIFQAEVCDFLGRGGRFFGVADSASDPTSHFLARICGLGPLPLNKTDSWSVGIPADVMASLNEAVSEDISTFPNQAQLLLDDLPFISDRDATCTLNRIVSCRQSRLKRYEKLYVILRDIGRPAHYSEITKAHNRRFVPSLTQKTVHSVLSREQAGVVWVGTRGTFGLTEQGSRRPGQPLFTQIADIVEAGYARLGQPMRKDAILAEIGRLRTTVNLSSINMALSLNPRIVPIAGGFIPAAAAAPNGKLDDDVNSVLERMLQS